MSFKKSIKTCVIAYLGLYSLTGVAAENTLPIHAQSATQMSQAARQAGMSCGFPGEDWLERHYTEHHPAL